MQCFTRANHYPKTTVRSDYEVPLPHIYRKRSFFVPEPAKIGRPWCPYGVVMPAPWEHIKRVQFNPLNELHREVHMDTMLESINKTNWTCGGDVVNFGGRKSKFSDSMRFSVQSTQRADYPGHWMGFTPKRKLIDCPSVGATPTTFHLAPYLDPQSHQFISKRPPGEYAENTSEETTPLVLPSYPYVLLRDNLRNRKSQEKEKVSKMGLVP